MDLALNNIHSWYAIKPKQTNKQTNTENAPFSKDPAAKKLKYIIWYVLLPPPYSQELQQN